MRIPLPHHFNTSHSFVRSFQEAAVGHYTIQSIVAGSAGILILNLALRCINSSSTCYMENIFTKEFSNYCQGFISRIQGGGQGSVFVPVVDCLQCLFKSKQHFRRGWPLHMFAIILHWSHVVKAPGHLVDVGLHFVAPVVLDDCEGSPCPLIAKAG